MARIFSTFSCRSARLWYMWWMSRPSAMMSPTFLRGFRLAMGSWKIICIWVRRLRLVAVSRWPLMSLPSKVIWPAVGSYSRMTLRPMVDLPEPDSPTRP